MTPSKTYIPTGLIIPSQIPFDNKVYFLSEAELINLGIDDNLAFTYFKGMEVYCAAEQTRYEWTEANDDNIGLLDDDFIYPSVWIKEGIDYSNKAYNFYLLNEPLWAFKRNGFGITRTIRNEANFGDVGFEANDLGYSDTPSSIIGALAFHSTIGGGRNNIIADTATGATISGGKQNRADGQYSSIGGGNQNLIDVNGAGSAIGGGENNVIIDGIAPTGGRNFIGGGGSNQISGVDSVIGGGFTNKILLTAQRATIAGGRNNTVNSSQSTINGGYSNTTNGVNSSIIGGSNNIAEGDSSTVLGGDSNVANSFGEVSAGLYGTIYSAVSKLIFSAADKIFNIGIGTDNSNRADAFSIFKSGLAFFPSLTIAMITAASGRVAVTKEYLSSVISALPTPDGTETKLINGTNTTVTGDGSNASKYQVHVTFPTPPITPQVVVLTLNTWFKDQQHSILTGLTGVVILNVQVLLTCTTANNGFVAGDTVTVNSPEIADSGGTGDQGIGIEFNNINPTIIRVLVNTVVSTMGAWTSDGASTGELIIGLESQWAIKVIVTYI